ncbi:chromosome partitioning protein ParB [Candidatus Saccharibacteria bacterium]|nr:MAG: chromosome partitioning protein ParB [Candidatus Saccharibacteria bacterium]
MKKGLGRGFDSLIPTNLIDETFDPTAKQDDKLSKLQDIPIGQIAPDPDQPRKHFDESSLEELAASVKKHGLVLPIVVSPHDGKFVIVAGERRYRAAKMVGLDKVPCIVRSLSGQHRLELSLIENLHRQDLNAIERATAYLKLRDQFNMTLEEIGARVDGKSASAVSNTLRLLNLPKFVQEALFESKITEGQARPLIGLPEKVVKQLMERIVKDGWSVRRIEQAVALWKQSDKLSDNSKQPAEQPHTEMAKKLTDRFKTDIKIRTNTRGAGQIVIKFKDQADFERISQLLN